jgi:hypothetical protein
MGFRATIAAMIAGSLYNKIQYEPPHKVGLEVGLKNFRHKKTL